MAQGKATIGSGEREVLHLQPNREERTLRFSHYPRSFPAPTFRLPSQPE